MNKEKIINELSRISTPTGFTPYGDYTLDDYTCDEILDYINEQEQENTNLKKENKILKENAENNDKVVDKVNWDNRLLKQALNEIRKKIKDKGQRHQMAVLEQMIVEDFCLDGYECSDILQIIDKAMGDDNQ